MRRNGETTISANTNQGSRFRLAEISLFLTAMIWGINMPIMKFALGHMDELLFNAMRLTCSAIVLGGYAAWKRSPVIDRTPTAPPIAQQRITIVTFSFLTSFAYQWLFLVAIDSTSAGNTAIIMATVPMWITILAILILNEFPSRSVWLGLVIAFLGTVIVTVSKNPVGGATLTGNLLVSAAAFSWSLGSVLSRPLLKNISPLALAAWSSVLALPFHWLLASRSVAQSASVLSDGWLVASILFSGVFSTGFALAFWNFGFKQLGAAQAAGFQNLVPLFAIVTAWLLINELPFPLQLVGGVVIVAGLIVMRRGRAATPNRNGTGP